MQLIKSSSVERDINVFASLMEKSVLYEAVCWPSPGLVSSKDSGCHKDMDIFTFIESSNSLSEVWSNAIKLAIDHPDDKSFNELFLNLKDLGIYAEKKMLVATNGINTHKGTIFLGILLCAGLGICMTRNEPIRAYQICNYAQLISKDALEAELLGNLKKDINHATTGIRAYKEYDIKGVRGEVLSGFNSILNYSLPCMKDMLNNGYNMQKVLSQTLLILMSIIEDTTLLNRKFDLYRIKLVKQWASICLEAGGVLTKEGEDILSQMQNEFVEKSLSPGGSADLLIMTLVLYWWEIYGQ